MRVNSVMVLSTHAELVSATARGRSYWETGQLDYLFYQIRKQCYITIMDKTVGSLDAIIITAIPIFTTEIRYGPWY